MANVCSIYLFDGNGVDERPATPPKTSPKVLRCRHQEGCLAVRRSNESPWERFLDHYVTVVRKGPSSMQVGLVSSRGASKVRRRWSI